MTMSESGKKSFPLAFLIVVLTFVILMSVIMLSLNGIARAGTEAGGEDETPRFDPSLNIDMMRLSGECAAPDFGTSVLKARQAMLEKDDDKAREILRDLILLYPESSLPRRMLADLCISHGDFEAAEHYLAPLIAGREDRADLLYDFSLVLGARGKFAAAADCMESAFMKNPSLSDATVYLAYFYLKSGRKKEAARFFTEACRRLGPGVRRFEFDDDYRAFLSEKEIAEQLRRFSPEGKEGAARE